MKELAKKLLLVSIFLSSTQVITVSRVGLSVFQIALIITFVVCVLGLIEVRYISKGRYIGFSIIAALSSYIAYEVSIYPAWAKSYFLLGILTAAFCFFIPVYFERDDLGKIVKAIIRSQYITIVFSLYSFYKFYFGGGIPNHISLFGGLYIELEEDFFIRGQASGQIRLALPYSTPPVLSVVMAVCIVILLFDQEMFSKIQKWTLLLVFIAILVLTGSRTGMIGLILFLTFEGGRYFHRNKSIPKWSFGVIFVGIIAFVIFIVKSGNSVYIQKYIHRFTKLFGEVALSEDRHFLVPLDGIIIWLSSIKNFVVGIGFGSSAKMVGAHTYLPPYFLNSFVTWVAERGMMGLYLVFTLLQLVFACKKQEKNLSVAEKSLTSALCVALITCMFYEVLVCYTVIIIIAACFIIIKEK